MEAFADIQKYSLILGIPIILYSIVYFIRQLVKSESPKKTQNRLKAFYTLDDVKSIDRNFDWTNAEAIKSFPFKNGPYKLTMGIKSLHIQDWLLVEPSYLNMIQNKFKIINNIHPDYPDRDMESCTVHSTPEATLAIHELYDMVINYYCKKYPMYFEKQGKNIINHITGSKTPSKASSKETLRSHLHYLASIMEEDFIILQKDSADGDDGEYYYKAGVFAFAAGFNPSDKFNTPLSFIHDPIPGYQQKLKVSMNRFFDKLEPGQFVTRSNFSMQLHSKLYVDDNNKGHSDIPQRQLRMEELDFDKQVHYRSERQTLTKLEKSKAIVFTIRTYLMPLSWLKKEDVSQRLIGAIKGFPDDIGFYKRSPEWGSAVMEYLST